MPIVTRPRALLGRIAARWARRRLERRLNVLAGNTPAGRWRI